MDRLHVTAYRARLLGRRLVSSREAGCWAKSPGRHLRPNAAPASRL